METKSVWCVKTHIVDDYETITDEVRLFKALEDGQKFFNEVVEEERRIANDKEWVIGCDANRYFDAYFEAYEDGYFAQSHSCVSLFEIEIE